MAFVEVSYKKSLLKFGLDRLSRLRSWIPNQKGQRMNVKNIIGLVEKLFLIIIAIFTVAAMGQEISSLIENRRVELQDLLLMFIYAEVLGMLAAFYYSHRIPITIPLFIAMTALSRLIILQGKDGNPAILLYESGAIIMIAGACWIISRVNKTKDSDREWLMPYELKRITELRIMLDWVSSGPELGLGGEFSGLDFMSPNVIISCSNATQYDYCRDCLL